LWVTRARRIGNLEFVSDQLETYIILEPVNASLPETELSPRTSLVSMLFNPRRWKGKELRLALSFPGLVEIPYVQEYGDDEVKGTAALSRNDNTAVTIGLVAALNLYADGSYFFSGVGVDTDQVVSFVFARSLIR